MFDCCMLNNELDILELRLEILYDVIEKFVVVESDTTHSGNPKELHVRNNLERFKKFESKLILLTYHGQLYPTEHKDAWLNEGNQRNMGIDAIANSPPEDGLCLVCDVDEIPDPVKLLEAKELAINTGMPIALEMRSCLYYLNFSAPTPPFRGPYLYDPTKAQQVHAMFGQTNFTPSYFRWHMCAPGYENDFPKIQNAGWHFSTLGGIEGIRHKFESYAHIEFNNEKFKDSSYLENCIKEGLYFSGVDNEVKLQKQEISFLPKYVQDNLDKYKKYILC